MIQRGNSREILNPLVYFNIFNHPLKISELAALHSLSIDELELQIDPLIKQGICFSENGFYGLNENIQDQIVERNKKEVLAQKYFDRLKLYTKLIKSFPFVKGVAISGSLSKGVMHEKGDIDYFIITAKNRLWVCRTLLIIFKKTILLNSRKYFCVNYFIDETNLEIKDRNIFTAVEITHLLPVFNSSLFERFRSKNAWTNEYFQNFKNPIPVNCFEGNSIVKKSTETLLSGKFGEKLDLLFLSLTLRKWKQKFKNFDAEKFELTMRSNRGISKHHPSDFQNKVLTAYQEHLDRLNLKK